MTEEVKHKYIDGDIGLIRMIGDLKKQLEDKNIPDEQKSQIEQHLEYLEQLRKQSSDLRTRSQLSAKAAADYTTDLNLGGSAIPVVSKDTGEEINVGLPAGLTSPPETVVSEAKSKIASYFSEMGMDGKDIESDIEKMLAPVFHRLMLSDSALLSLRDFYLLEIQYLPQRTAAMLSELVAKAEIITGGTFQVPLAIMKGYTEEKWNFSPIPLNEDPDDLSCRKLVVISGGYEYPVVVYSHIKVERFPTADGQGMLAAGIDPYLLQIITEDSQLIPMASIGAWREATEEELASDVFKAGTEIHEKDTMTYNMVIAQIKAQAAATKQSQLNLVTDPDVDEATGLILPDNMK